MKKEHLEILAKIIGGVESGGQIYGGQNYAAYAGKAANSANENLSMQPLRRTFTKAVVCVIC